MSATTPSPGSASGATFELSEIDAEYYPGQPILRELTLRARPGEVTLILGPNGSGKSTALRVMAGLLAPIAGRVRLMSGGKVIDVTGLPAHRMPAHGVAYLPQGHSVFPAMSVHQNLLMGAWALRRRRRAVATAVDQVYSRYPLLHEKRHSAAGSLSGGQQRILEVARLLVPDPCVVLIDEPSAGVAPAIATTMYEEISRMRADGRTVVLVDQDVRPALAVADRVYLMRSGRNERDADADELANETSELARAWLGIPGTAVVP